MRNRTYDLEAVCGGGVGGGTLGSSPNPPQPPTSQKSLSSPHLKKKVGKTNVHNVKREHKLCHLACCLLLFVVVVFTRM